MNININQRVRYAVPLMSKPKWHTEDVCRPLDQLTVQFRTTAKTLGGIYLGYWQKLFCRWMFDLIKLLASGSQCRIAGDVSFAMDTTDYELVEIDSRSILEKIRLSNAEATRMCNEQIKHICCGRDEFSRIVREIHEKRLFSSFPMPPVEFYSGRQRITLYGMTITCVPWMEGLVLLPDLK